MSIKLNKELKIVLLNHVDFNYYFKKNSTLKNTFDSKFSTCISKKIFIDRINCLVVEFEDTYFLLKNRHTDYLLHNIGFKEIRLEDIQFKHKWLLKNVFNQNILIKIDLMTILALNKG